MRDEIKIPQWWYKIFEKRLKVDLTVSEKCYSSHCKMLIMQISKQSCFMRKCKIYNSYPLTYNKIQVVLKGKYKIITLYQIVKFDAFTLSLGFGVRLKLAWLNTSYWKAQRKFISSIIFQEQTTSTIRRQK